MYDIKSKTKTNKAQRYRYYITPLEIIAVIMGGEGDYVRQYESYVFDNIVCWSKNLPNFNKRCVSSRTQSKNQQKLILIQLSHLRSHENFV